MRFFKKPTFATTSRKFVLDPDRSSATFGPSYGNDVANERALRERWQPNREPLRIPEATDACPTCSPD